MWVLHELAHNERAQSFTEILEFGSQSICLIIKEIRERLVAVQKKLMQES